MRQPDPVVIALRRQEDLCLMLEPAECLGVDDPVAIALEDRSEVVLRLRRLPPLAERSEGSSGRKRLALDLLGVFSRGGSSARGAHAGIVPPGSDSPGECPSSFRRKRSTASCAP